VDRENELDAGKREKEGQRPKASGIKQAVYEAGCNAM
jgi:hypothetical protein